MRPSGSATEMSFKCDWDRPSALVSPSFWKSRLKSRPLGAEARSVLGCAEIVGVKGSWLQPSRVCSASEGEKL